MAELYLGNKCHNIITEPIIVTSACNIKLQNRVYKVYTFSHTPIRDITIYWGNLKHRTLKEWKGCRICIHSHSQ